MVRNWLWLIALVWAAAAGPATAADGWQQLEPGLQVAHFDSRQRAFASQGDLTVLRVEPQLYDLKLLVAGSDDKTLAQWCQEFGLVAAINAGMYQVDRQTHVGFCQVAGKVVNGFANDYLSAVAFDPVDPQEPVFRLFDLDVTPLAEVRRRYRNVAQNLRLIKRSRENRWQPAADQWRESALAEDSQGRVLFVYCRTAWSMYQFNELLLSLPLAIVAAQHLEGRSPAGLLINHPAYEGGPEAGASGPGLGPVIPNVLGVSGR